MEESRLAIQLYSLRNEGDLARQLDIARDAGFSAVETTQAQMEDAAATRRLLDARDLAAASGHVALKALRERRPWLIEAARTLGLAELVVPALPVEERRRGAVGWRQAGAELGELAAELRGAGIALAYHNHDWELRPLATGEIPLDLLLGAGGLGWQADLAWAIKGGADPAAWLARHGARVASIHVKDIAPPGEARGEDGWADVGHGVVDWEKLWRRCEETGARWMIAEHDKPSDGARFARRSLATMRRLACAAA
jgi:sugar phosphate isomerase/epimerase